MSIQKIFGGIAILALVSLCGADLFISDAWAWHGGGKGKSQHERLSPEQQAKYDAVLKAHREKMAPLTEKMMARRLELDALTGNANADPKRIATLAEEIASLRTQARQERRALNDQLKSEVGLPDRSEARRYGRFDKRNGPCGDFRSQRDQGNRSRNF